MKTSGLNKKYEKLSMICKRENALFDVLSGGGGTPKSFSGREFMSQPSPLTPLPPERGSRMLLPEGGTENRLGETQQKSSVYLSGRRCA